MMFMPIALFHHVKRCPMPDALPIFLLEHLESYPITAIPPTATISELLTAAHCVQLETSAEIPFPLVPVDGVAAQTVDLIEVEIATSVSLEEFRQTLVEAGHRPAGVHSLLRLLSELEVFDRRWPPVLCLLESDNVTLLEFYAFSGTIYASLVNVNNGIDGHYLFVALPK